MTRSSLFFAVCSFTCAFKQVTSLVPSHYRSPARIAETAFPRNIQLQNGMWSGDDELQGSDRIKACVPYILPILDGDQFGHFIYQRMPPLGFLDDIILGPLLNIYHGVPFLSIILYLTLTLGSRGNTNMARGVRFNAQQAALLDVALIFPELLGSGVEGVDVPRYIMEPSTNFVYYICVFVIGYCIYSNLKGEKPNLIPYISQYAETMTGPM